jgi:hypothetical protein
MYHNKVCIVCCDGGTVYKQKLVDAKLKTGKRCQKNRDDWDRLIL